jgi:hypothetical protein
MKKNSALLWLALAVLMGAAILTACSESDSGDASAGVLAQTVEDGLLLDADPELVVIDLTDPSTPTDPDNEDKAYHETVLTVSAYDVDTQDPQPDLEITLGSNAGMFVDPVGTGGTEEDDSVTVVTDENGEASATLRLYEDDPSMVVATATDGTRQETIDITLTVIYPNEPPVADAGGDVSEECDSNGGTMITLDGSGSSDPDSTPGTNDDIVAFEWFEDFGTADETMIAEGETANVIFEVGVHDVTLRVTDSEGETDTDDVVVEIVDTVPPMVDLTLSPDYLWPPNHTMRDVTAMLDISDCSEVTVVLVSVESSEPPNGIGDGNTEPDIMGADIGTEDYHFQLRSERSGALSGRTYTVVYRVTDAEENETTVTGYVVAPHDQGS